MATIQDEELRHTMQQHVHAKALLLSMKHVFDETLQQCLETVLLPFYQMLDQKGYSDDVADMLYYLYNVGNLNNDNQFWNFIHQQFSKDVEEKVMTLGQQAAQKALQQGMQETACRMLNEKLDIHLITKVTNLSIEEIKKLAKNHH